MKITIHDTAALANAINTAKKLLPKQGPDFARSVKLSASPDGKVQMFATALDAHMLCDIDASAEGTGHVGFEFHELEQVLKKAKSASRIVLEHTPGGEKVKFEVGKLKFDTPDTAPDYPEIPVPQFSWAVMPQEFAGYLARALEFASTDSTRANLTGVHMRQREEGVRIESTDGHRAYYATMPEECIAGGLKTLTVPPLLAEIVAGLTKRKEFARDCIGMGTWTNQVAFKVGPYLFWGSTLDMSFPDLDNAIPDLGTMGEIVVSAAELKEAVETVSIFAPAKTKAVVFDLTYSGLDVSTSNSDSGKSANVELAAEHNMNRGRAGFNFSYLLDTLAIWPKADKVSLHMSHDGKSRSLDVAVFRCAGSTEHMLVMPVRF
jgi:DNA polymerase III sliding clamp (beta) subunit (PCNA family)